MARRHCSPGLGRPRLFIVSADFPQVPRIPLHRAHYEAGKLFQEEEPM